MKRLLFLFCLIPIIGFSQKKCDKPTYYKNGTTYYVDSVYKSTGLPVVKRSHKAKREFLKQLGYNKQPAGYDIDHIIPLHQGGTDTPCNMQLITKEAHKAKTKNERNLIRQLKHEKKTN